MPQFPKKSKSYGGLARYEDFYNRPYPRIFCKHGVNVYFACVGCQEAAKLAAKKKLLRAGSSKK